MFNRILVGALCLSAAAFAADNGNGQGNGNDVTPGANGNGKVLHELNGAKASNSSSSGSGIVYHGGAVIATPNVYYIWYGSWDGGSQTILTDFASNIGGSPYFGINKTYYSSINGTVTRVSGAVTPAVATSTGYTHGTTLSDAAVQAIVSDAITSRALPSDTNGVYFVLTSADVKESSGFCTQYCGWHTHANIGGADIKYAFVGNPATQCLSSCSAQTASSPNGNLGADAMASIIAHELEEATTDPDLNAWYDRRGQENADKCAWTFGTTYTATNGSKANVKLGSRDYLIQQNWVNSGSGYCAMK
jgi:hypothetical protein